MLNISNINAAMKEEVLRVEKGQQVIWFQYKTYLHNEEVTHILCATLSLMYSQFISFNSFFIRCALLSKFRQNLIHLFCAH